MTFINLYHKLILEHAYAILCSFQLSQHKPHLGLPRTWIISPKAIQIAGILGAELPLAMNALR